MHYTYVLFNILYVETINPKKKYDITENVMQPIRIKLKSLQSINPNDYYLTYLLNVVGYDRCCYSF